MTQKEGELRMVMLKMLSNTTPAISVLFATSRKGVDRVTIILGVTIIGKDLLQAVYLSIKIKLSR